MIKANTKYEAICIDAGFTAKNQPTMRFKTEDGEVNWFGHLGTAALPSEKGITFASKALTAAGFVGNDFADLSLPFEVCFKPQTVQIETELDNKGKVRVKWVNELNQKRERRTVDGAVIPSGKSAFAKLRKDQVPF